MSDYAEAVEQLAAEFHSVYQQELRRQGGTSRHPDNYDDLSENLKDLDRALARFVLARENWNRNIDAKLTFLLDHTYNVPKDWRERIAEIEEKKGTK